MEQTAQLSQRSPGSIRPGKLRDLLSGRVSKERIWMPLILVLLIVAFGIDKPDAFFSSGNFRGMALGASFLIVMTIGQTYVLTTGGIDLSVGSVLVFSSVIGAKVMEGAGAVANSSGIVGGGTGAILLGLVACVLTGLLWGIVNGFLVAIARVPPLIVTLGTYGAALGLSEVITKGSDLYSVPPQLTRSLGSGTIAGIPNQLWLAIVIAAVAAYFLARTRFGFHTKAIGSNVEAARRSGIPVTRHLIRVYAISGTLAGFAGIMTLAEFGATSVSGHTSDNLATIAAAVLGGTSLFGGIGTVFGSLVGVFVPVVLQSGFVIVGIQAYWQTVAVGAVLVLAVYIDQFQQRRRAAG